MQHRASLHYALCTMLHTATAPGATTEAYKASIISRIICST